MVTNVNRLRGSTQNSGSINNVNELSHSVLSRSPTIYIIITAIITMILIQPEGTRKLQVDPKWRPFWAAVSLLFLRSFNTIVDIWLVSDKQSYHHAVFGIIVILSVSAH